eukprot:UC4_evm3s1540
MPPPKPPGRNSREEFNPFDQEFRQPQPREVKRIKAPAMKTHPVELDYDIEWGSSVGKGASGHVYRCTRKADGKRCVLKFMVTEPERRHIRSKREIELHFECSAHPNVPVDIYDLTMKRGPHDINPPNHYYAITIEFLEGGELFKRIARKSKFTEDEAKKTVKQIASALAHCHALGIAHRDLKPENLLMVSNSEDSEVKIADFGFAKRDEGGETLQTPLYTPYYVPPQILKARQLYKDARRAQRPPATFYYDKSCDMWSLGVIIYILLTGRPPFYSENIAQDLSQKMIKKIQKGEYEMKEKYWGNISDHAKDVVRKLLVVDSRKRLTADGLLCHPWIKSLGGDTPDCTLMSPQVLVDTMDELKAAMAGTNDFRQASSMTWAWRDYNSDALAPSYSPAQQHFQSLQMSSSLQEANQDSEIFSTRSFLEEVPQCLSIFVDYGGWDPLSFRFRGDISVEEWKDLLEKVKEKWGQFCANK